ncbi:hypothetical protein L596_001060 [Steinernema carpocapsae]|uniref:Uncharacterized protein n=1 Tax=Steinernema carpocapsae TaxID=34508 RepID=A0A4U8UKN6_STECR|nr:hypothetical protein L596_001060 [Steinernema carpocapsae]
MSQNLLRTLYLVRCGPYVPVRVPRILNDVPDGSNGAHGSSCICVCTHFAIIGFATASALKLVPQVPNWSQLRVFLGSIKYCTKFETE